MDTCPPIELSDDENRGDVDKMPPPAFVPSKPAKEKKAPAEKKIRSTRSKQTKRKVRSSIHRMILLRFEDNGNVIFLFIFISGQTRACIGK